MNKKLKRLLPYILILILIAIPTIFIWFLLKEYREMKMWGDISSLKEFLETQVRPFAYVLFTIVFISLIGSFIKRLAGWILTIHFFYFVFVYGISVTTYLPDFQFIITLLPFCLMIAFMNSKSILRHYKIEDKKMLTFNLLSIVIAMTMVLSFRNMILH